MSRRLTRRQRAAQRKREKCGPTGKRRYRTAGAASRALEDLAAIRPDPHRREQRAYPCDGCGGWHLTKQLRGVLRGDVAGGVRDRPARKEA
jgi:hypothetical protein